MDIFEEGVFLFGKSSETFETFSKYIQETLFDANPSSWENVLKNLTSSDHLVKELSEKLKIPTNVVYTFLNKTLDCIDTIRVEQPGLGGGKLREFVEKNCLEYGHSIDITQCSYLQDVNATITGSIVLCSLLFILALSCCVYSRKECAPYMCYGRPAPVVPLNLLDSYENRRGFGIAFGITVVSCVSILVGNYADVIGTSAAQKISQLPTFLSTFIKMGLAAIVAIKSYPFFVCQRLSNKLIGGIFGVLFCLLFLGLEIAKIVFQVTVCWQELESSRIPKAGILLMLLDLPKLICLFLLIYKFSHMIHTAVKRRLCYRKSGYDIRIIFENDMDWKLSYIYKHVKGLLVKRTLKNTEDEEELTFVQKLRGKLYEVRPGFKYSTRMIASFVVASITIYILVISCVFFGYVVFTVLWYEILSSDVITSLSKWLSITEEEVEMYGYCLVVSWWASVAVALSFYIVVVMNSLTWYRRHILMLRRGDRSFVPNSLSKGTLEPSALMTASMKFAGFQVAYSAWGFIINGVIWFLIFAILTTQIFLPMKTLKMSFLLEILRDYWPTIIVGALTALIQRLSSSLCFLISKDTVAVDNRQAFHINSYFMFYFNIFLGFGSCLLRIVLSILYGVLFLQRLQKSSLPRSYEKNDPGYLTYLGYIVLEHQHGNPVLQCFVRLLLETQGKLLKHDYISDKVITDKVKVLSYQLDNGFSTKKTTDFHHQRAINRWHLYLMLHQNPSLQRYRKKEKQRTKMVEKALHGVLTTILDYDVSKTVPLKNISEAFGEGNIAYDISTDHCENISLNKLSKEEEEAAPQSIHSVTNHDNHIQQADDPSKHMTSFQRRFDVT